MCPHGARFFNGEGGALSRARFVCHVLVIERSDGLTLVDTGFGTEHVRNPRKFGVPFRALLSPRPTLAETALGQVRALGFEPGDVRHIVLTHLDLDHAGGLSDFPDAEIHVFGPEYDAFKRPPLSQRPRYALTNAILGGEPRWVRHALQGDTWNGFESVRVLPGGDDEILLVPLRGHTLGHTGIAVRRDEDWLLHCGDAYFNRGEVQTPVRRPPGLAVFQALTQADGQLRHQNQERLRELAERPAGEVALICSHDPVSLELAQAATR
jgi:glyoxylase-like metal-dependent hydrolase (beta-lactamase superfamily II)